MSWKQNVEHEEHGNDGHEADLANDPVEEEGRLPLAALSQPAEPETIIHQRGLAAGHQLILVIQSPGKLYQASVGPAGGFRLSFCSGQL